MEGTMVKFSYDEWITEQSEKIRSGLNRLACSGVFNAAVYVMPSSGKTPGELVLACEQPEGTCDVVRFPGIGDRVCAVAYSHLHSALWHACRRMPICPTE
jgi:hypothetical protein